MGRKNQVGSFWEEKRQAFGKRRGLSTRHPTAQSAAYPARDDVASPTASTAGGEQRAQPPAPTNAAPAGGVALRRILFVQLARFTASIEEKQTVMHNRARRRTKVDGAPPLIFG